MTAGGNLALWLSTWGLAPDQLGPNPTPAPSCCPRGLGQASSLLWSSMTPSIQWENRVPLGVGG